MRSSDMPMPVFPPTLVGFKKEAMLGGSTQSVFSIYNKDTQQRFVLKLGANINACKIEILTNTAYRLLGVNVPPFQVYRDIPAELAAELGLSTQVGTFQVSQYIDSHPDKQDENTIISMAQQSFMAHVLLGNTDHKPDNYIVDVNNTTWLIDAGSNFIFRARGERRHENPSQASELDSLKDPGKNTLHHWFNSLSDEDARKQLEKILENRASLEEALWNVSHDIALSSELREEYLDCLSDRLDQLSARFFQTLACHSTKVDKKASADHTAAGVLTYTMINGKPHVLLSKRSKHDWWANFGGKSDISDGYLFMTAMREVAEESGGLLLYDERQLLNTPSHDFLTERDGQPPFIYRLYLAYHEYINVDQIKDGEHTAHRWVALDELLAAMNNSKEVMCEGQGTKAIMTADDEMLYLYPAFHRMLKQPRLMTQLTTLHETGKLRGQHTQGSAMVSVKNTGYRPLVSPFYKRHKLYNSLVSKSHVIRELKRQRGNRTSHVEALPDLESAEIKSDKLDHNRLSQSEIHLKAILGDQYVENSLLRNVTTFVEKYYLPLISASDAGTLIEKCVSLIEREKIDSENHLFFYHGCNNEIAFAYDVYTAIYRMLYMSDEKNAFRLDGEYTSRFLSINEFIAFYSQNGKNDINNNDAHYNDCAISTNLFLFGNHNNDTSSTIHYFVFNDVRRRVDLKSLFKIALFPFSVSEVEIAKLVTLYDQYASKRRGLLYQIKMNKNVAASMSYPAGCLGVMNAYHGDTDINSILDTLRTRSDANYVESLQARLMVSPHVPMTVSGVTWNSTLSEAEQVKYERALHDCVASIVYKMAMNRKLGHLHRAPLLFALQAVEAANTIPEKKCLSSISLVQAIMSKNSAVVKQKLMENPELISTEITYNETYLEKHSLGCQKKLVLDAVISELPEGGKIIFEVYGMSWWNRLDLINALSFQSVCLYLKQIPSDLKFDFLKIIAGKIVDCSQTTESQRLLRIVEALPAHLRLDALERYDDFLVGRDLAALLKLLPEPSRVAFVHQHQHLISDGRILRDIAEAMPTDCIHDVIYQYRDRIKNGFELANCMMLLQTSSRMKLANACAHVIHDVAELRFVLYGLTDAPQFSMRYLSFFNESPRLAFLKRHSDLIKSGYHLAAALDSLPLEDRELFAKSQRHKIDNGIELAKVLDELRDVSRFEFARSKINVIKSEYELARVLDALFFEPMKRKDQLRNEWCKHQSSDVYASDGLPAFRMN